MVSALRPDTQGARIGMLFLSYALRRHRSHCNISFHLELHNCTLDGRISRLHSWRSFLVEHAPLFEQKLACRAGFIASNAFGSSFRSRSHTYNSIAFNAGSNLCGFAHPWIPEPNFTVQQILHTAQRDRAMSLQNSPTVHTRHWGFVSKSAQPTYSTNGYSFEQTR